MSTKIQTALAAAFVVVSATAAMAQYAPNPVYQGQPMRAPVAQDYALERDAYAQDRLIEGRNVGVYGPANIYQVPAEQRTWIDRNSPDFQN